MVRGHILTMAVAKAMAMLLKPEDQPRAGRAWYGAGRSAAEGDGSATASGEHGPQNGVAGHQHQTSGAEAGDPLQVQDPWVPAGRSTAARDSGLVREEAATWQTRSWDNTWNHDQWGAHDWSAGGWRGSDWQWDQWGSSFNTKPDMLDPPTWPGWSHRRLWIQAIRRWNKQTDIPLHRRADRVLRSLGWDLQSDFEHLDDEVLSSTLYLEAIIEVMNAKAGVREDDEKRRAYRQAISENQRLREESLAQYAIRRQKDFRNAANYGVVIPNSLKAMLLKEGAGLSDQNQQNLTALLQGNDEDPDLVARCLSRMDVRSDRLSAYVDDAAREPSYLADTDATSEDDDVFENEEVLQELDKMELNEDQICEVFAVLERKRSWKENKLFKADIRKDRGSFIKDGTNGYPRGQAGGPPAGGVAGRNPSRQGFNRDQLKKISRCRLCQKKGHWAAECPSKKGAGGATAFAYCSASADVSRSAFTFLSVMEVRQAIHQVLYGDDQHGDGGWAFLTLDGGEAVLDIGATQDLIGLSALEDLTKELKKVGLQPVRIDKPVTTPTGIGGSARALYAVLLPISPGGIPGILEMTVLEGNVPPLLSVGFPRLSQGVHRPFRGQAGAANFEPGVAHEQGLNWSPHYLLGQVEGW